MNGKRDMTRDEILRRIQAHREEIIARFDIDALGLFGSAAREEMTADSDVDILVAFRDAPNYAAYLGLKRFIEGIVGRLVDLITETGLKPRARTTVEKDLVRVA